MKYPDPLDFLNVFGLEPSEVEPSMAYFKYFKCSQDDLHRLTFSFSAVEESFQVSLEFKGVEVISISSEMVKLIEIIDCDSEPCVKIVFEI
jgi:hypothetical protein